jgi:endonuclease/exonuclease/phosphatase family metal-dependent hydrolase
MTSIRVAFANICQGLICEGKKNHRDVFSRHWPSAYIDLYVSLDPDVICFAEVPIDDDSGNSRFLDCIAKGLGAVAFRADVHEKSWLVEGKYYGTAVVTRLPLVHYSSLKLPNPGLQVDNPDGSRWTSHDKTLQCATIAAPETEVRVFNLHYFPFTRFKRDIGESEFKPMRAALISQLRLSDGMPTIVTGDFNNGGGELKSSFPELFEGGQLTEAAEFGVDQFDDYYAGKYQLDHVLYTRRHFRVTHSEIVRDNSDHRGIVADIDIVKA